MNLEIGSNRTISGTNTGDLFATDIDLERVAFTFQGRSVAGSVLAELLGLHEPDPAIVSAPPTPPFA